MPLHPVTALIVTYNSAGHARTCALAAARYCAEVLIVDNASTDATLAEIPTDTASHTHVIANTHNLGFAGAVNQGLAAAAHNLVLLINPDAELLDDPAPLLQECEAAHAAVAAGLLVDATGRAQAGFTVRRFPTPAALAFEALGINRLWPANPVNRHWRALDLDLSQPQNVQQPAGAFLLIRRAAWQQVQGFDARFHPVWFEDVDFLMRIADAGLLIRFNPRVRARHTGGHSVGRLEGGQRVEYWYGSLLQYAGKHFSPAGKSAVALAVSLGAAVRWVLAGGQGPAAQANRAGYGRVIQLAVRSFVGRGVV
jgi:N-acetylglucosaminyl-diphospho-decaprenol L-rhamnosyltransferase